MPDVNESIQIQSDEDHGDITDQKDDIEKLDKNNKPVERTRKTAKKEKVRNYSENVLHRLVSEERISVLQKLTHNIVPGFNINVKKSKSKNLSNFPLFQCSIPNCICISSEHPNKVDLCHKRTSEHYDYMYYLNRQRAFYEVAEKKKDFKKSMKKGVYPYTVVSYAELLENNPDPYFQARFDWYYTGGNLKCNSDNNLVCHSMGNNLNDLVLSRSKKKSKTHNLKAITTMNFLPLNDLPNSEIFEIQSLAFKNRFSVRQKYSLSLLTYDDNDLICDYRIFSNEIPFITSRGDDFDPVLIATGNLNKEVFLWDVNSSTTIPKQKLYQNNLDNIKMSRNWNCLCNLESNIFAFTTLNEFCLLDCRQSANESKNNLFTFGKYKEICEDISSLAKSSYNNMIYFGTTHKLFSVDTRFMSKEISDKYVIQRWTHQMESAPLILKLYNYAESYELIAMSSILSGDVRICENFSKDYKHKYVSPCLPFIPPSLLDGYKTAKIHGECLDPVTNLEKRINSCTTGLDFLKKNDNLYILFSNSLGDIFSTKLNFNDDIKYSDKNNIDIIVKYNEKVKMQLEENPLPLNLTDFVQLQGMNKVFRCKRLNNVKKKLNNSNNDQESTNITNADDEPEPKRSTRRAKWQKSLNELYAYKDVLASNLLAVWDMELTEEKDILPVIDNKAKKQHDIVRVNEWLNETDFFNNTVEEIPVAEIDLEKYTPSFNEITHSTLKPSTQKVYSLIQKKKPLPRKEVNQTQNTILEDSFMIDNPLKTSTQYKINNVERMEIDESLDVSKKSLQSNSDVEILPAQIPVKKTSRPKITEKRKRTYVKGF